MELQHDLVMADLSMSHAQERSGASLSTVQYVWVTPRMAGGKGLARTAEILNPVDGQHRGAGTTYSIGGVC